MRILDASGEELTAAQADLTLGYFAEETIIRPDAAPVDNINKFAYDDGDYEEIQRYFPVPEQVRLQHRIDALKRELADTDYAVIKIAEGAATAEEYAELIARRQACRAEINALEGA